MLAQEKKKLDAAKPQTASSCSNLSKKRKRRVCEGGMTPKNRLVIPGRA
jgi:hypothetical protein